MRIPIYRDLVVGILPAVSGLEPIVFGAGYRGCREVGCSDMDVL